MLDNSCIRYFCTTFTGAAGVLDQLKAHSSKLTAQELFQQRLSVAQSRHITTSLCSPKRRDWLSFMANMFRSSLFKSSNQAFLSPVTSGSARHLSPRNGCASSRSLATLREKHKNYLALVKSHGGGSVTLSFDYPKQIATLSLSNEFLRNAISGRMMNQLADTLDILLDDGSKKKKTVDENDETANLSIVGLILRCSGDIFSAGADLHLAKDVGNSLAFFHSYPSQCPLNHTLASHITDNMICTFNILRNRQ